MDILALDFDGVICRSAGEACVSGWKAAGRLWPERFRGVVPAAVLGGFERVRPVMEVGFQAVLLVRLLHDGCPVEEILGHAPSLFSDLMRREALSRDRLVRLFGTTRDGWMAENLSEWIGYHGFYAGTVEAMNQSACPAYIITTKEKRFAVALCAAAGLRLPEDQVFGLESGRKSMVLRQLARRHPNARIHFLEDRLGALLQADAGVGVDLRLYWAAWGYHTRAESIRAAALADITVLSLEQFPDFARMPSSFATRL
jgi:hypothetical protein